MLVPIKQVKPNAKNPRTIKDAKFDKLVKSIQDFPDMLNKRPLVCFTDLDGKYVVLGGNMRLKACEHLKYKEVPIMLADEWTEEQKAEFLIKDNVGFGEWNHEVLVNEWDTDKLIEWGMDLPVFESLSDEEIILDEEKNKAPKLTITFKDVSHLQKAEIDIQELIDRKYEGAYFSVSAGVI